jgi:hypothetical protein
MGWREQAHVAMADDQACRHTLGLELLAFSKARLAGVPQALLAALWEAIDALARRGGASEGDRDGDPAPARTPSRA